MHKHGCTEGTRSSAHTHTVLYFLLRKESQYLDNKLGTSYEVITAIRGKLSRVPAHADENNKRCLFAPNVENVFAEFT
jgi:hypothetical protein